MPNLAPPTGYPYNLKDPVPHDDLNFLIDEYKKAPNADEGSSHAPTDVIAWSGTNGGGFTFADAFKLSGDTDVSDDLVFGAASSGSVAFGKFVSVDVRGPMSFKAATAGAPGSAQWESGASATFLSGATLTCSTGSTANLTGAVNFRGTVIYRSSGGPAVVTVQTGVVWTCDSGSTLNLNGNVAIGSGALVSSDGFSVTGSEISMQAPFKFAVGVVPALSPARAWHRRAFKCAASTEVADVPQGVDNKLSPLFDAPSLYIEGGSSTGVESIFEIYPPPDGALIVTVTIKSVLASNPLGSIVVPSYRFVRWGDGLTDAVTNLSALTTDDHAADGSNWNTVITTTITVTLSTYADLQYRYGVRVSSGYTSLGDVRLGLYLGIKVNGTNDALTGT